jgi:hypothetical protein
MPYFAGSQATLLVKCTQAQADCPGGIGDQLMTIYPVWEEGHLKCSRCKCQLAHLYMGEHQCTLPLKIKEHNTVKILGDTGRCHCVFCGQLWAKHAEHHNCYAINKMR